MFLFELDWTPYTDLSFIGSNYDYQDCFNRTSRMTEDGIEQFGYIDIKQHPKVKGRKLKSWKKKWVVLHEMSIRSAGRTAAKVDVYTDEATAIKSPADKVTFILEYVTDVRVAKSKKHEHAFEIVETEPVLLLAGETEYETQTWLMAFKKIFWPGQAEKDEFTTTIIQNEHTKRLMLEGTYQMIISPEVISIQSATCNSYEWSLRMLRRFNQDKHKDFPTEDVLTIESGPKSECGEAKFQFRAENVPEILAAIKRNIFKAVNNKKAESPGHNKPLSDKPWRTSVTSTTSDDSQRFRSSTLDSEQKYRDLLESPMQESKRKRLNSESSEQSRRSSEDSMSVIPKKTLSVTFEDEHEKETSTVDELLKSDEHKLDEEDEYNRLNLSGRRLSATNTNIITTFTVARPGYQTKVLLDDRGYSHVGISANGPAIEDDKSRSLSNISSQSAMSFRSDSTNSGDSGCLQENNKKDQFNVRSHRSTNSFDSAVSTISSTIDQSDSSNDKLTSKTPITVEVQELEMTAEEIEREQNGENENKTGHSNIYQDVEIESELKNDANKTVNDSQALVKSRSCSDFNNTENHYEELENYRKGKKNLVKHLGMDPKMDPTSIPPALPERPLSHKMKRKFKHSEKKLFTLPFVKSKSKKDKGRSRSGSSSSESDAEEGKYREELSISAWPLGNKSVTVGQNDIYHPVNIERYLNDDEDNIAPTKRERSCSLNLNTSTQMRRPSEVAEKTNSRWRHNRNMSMNVDLFQRMRDSDRTELNTGFSSKLQTPSFMETIDSSDIICDKSNVSEKVVYDDEPIYAEVQPLKKDHHELVDEPFPDIDSWKPHSPRVSRKNLDDTYYENDPLNKSNESDILNEGFVSTDTNQVADLIDLSFDNATSSFDNRTSKTAVEIFALANNNPVFPNNNREISQIQNTSTDLLDIFNLDVMTPLPESTSNLLTSNSKASFILNDTVGLQNYSVNQTHESVYMDMTSCKNESIYVEPSTLKNKEKN